MSQGSQAGADPKCGGSWLAAGGTENHLSLELDNDGRGPGLLGHVLCHGDSVALSPGRDIPPSRAKGLPGRAKALRGPGLLGHVLCHGDVCSAMETASPQQRPDPWT